MAGIKEIRTRIDSVQQTLKITNAMYLISSSKLRKARQQLNNVQPYFLKISSTIADILHHSPEIEHIYFDKRPEVKRRKSGYIVITGDKGLAGAYNHNVLRLAEKHLAQEDDPTLFLIGQMGRAYFAERDIRVDGEFMFTVQDPTIARARDIADIFIRLFRDDPAVTAVALPAFHYQCLAMLLQPIIVVANMTFQSVGASGRATFLACCRQGVFFIPLILILPRTHGLFGVEICQPIADVLTFLVSLPFLLAFLQQLGRMDDAEQSKTAS